MTFAKDTIKLGAARSIFSDVLIEEIKIGDRTAGYKATLPNDPNNEAMIEDTSLTKLCERIWGITQQRLWEALSR